MGFHRLVSLLIVGCLFAVLTALAQDSAGPIVIADGFSRTPDANLYQLDEDRLVLLSETLHVTNAAPSPNGRFLAANVMAPLVFESEGCSGPIPTDLWLLNRETEETLLLGAQPENATYCGDDNNVSRSEVDWSPNGEQFAWTEYNSGDDTLSFGVYDLAAGRVNVVPLDFLEQHGAGPGPVTPYWLASGIAFYSVTYDDAQADSALAVRLYTPDGTFIAETPVWLAHDYGQPDTVLLVTHRGRDYAAHHWFSSDFWTLYDLVNQEKLWFGATPAYPELVSAVRPESSLRVRLQPVADSLALGSGSFYQVVVLDAAGNVLRESLGIKVAQDAPQVMALSPDGQTLAFRPYNVDTRVYKNQINSIGAAALSYVPSEDINHIALSWGSWQWIFPEELDLIEFPDALG